MNGIKGYEQAFKFCRTNLRIVGLWPNTNNPKYEDYISFTLFTMSFFIIITFVNVAQTTKLFMIWGDLNLMINNLSTANLPIAVVVIKMLLFRSFRKEMSLLISAVMADWKAEKTPEESENMKSNALTTRKISWLCMILGLGSVNGQTLLRISQELGILAGPTEMRQPMLSSHFPYDYQPSPIYELTWALQYMGAGLATLVYSGVYCLFVGLVLHLRGQVANLRLRLENLGRDSVQSTDREFQRKIGSIVERHEALNRFAREIEKIFNGMFLAEIISCTVQICLQLFLLVTTIGDNDANESLPILEILFMVVYVMHVGTHVFICCFVADKLQDESLSICQSAYNIPWYNIPPQDAKLLLIVMHRSKKPLIVTAGKFCSFSIRLYAQILKTSGGYLSMLLAVKDRL